MLAILKTFARVTWWHVAVAAVAVSAVAFAVGKYHAGAEVPQGVFTLLGSALGAAFAVLGGLYLAQHNLRSDSMAQSRSLRGDVLLLYFVIKRLLDGWQNPIVDNDSSIAEVERCLDAIGSRFPLDPRVPDAVELEFRLLRFFGDALRSHLARMRTEPHKLSDDDFGDFAVKVHAVTVHITATIQQIAKVIEDRTPSVEPLAFEAIMTLLVGGADG